MNYPMWSVLLDISVEQYATNMEVQPTVYDAARLITGQQKQNFVMLPKMLWLFLPNLRALIPEMLLLFLYQV